MTTKIPYYRIRCCKPNQPDMFIRIYATTLWEAEQRAMKHLPRIFTKNYKNVVLEERYKANNKGVYQYRRVMVLYPRFLI